MSEHWTVYCAVCDEFGPDIVRTASNVFLSGVWPRYHPDLAPSAPRTSARANWSEFLREHGSHHLTLVHE